MQAFTSHLHRSRSATTEERAQLSHSSAPNRGLLEGSCNCLLCAYFRRRASCGANMHACMSRRHFIQTHVSWSNSECCATAPYQCEGRAAVQRRCSPQTCSSSSSARRNAAICPRHMDAIKNTIINPLFALTVMQHVRCCCACTGMSVRTGNARQLNTEYFNAEK